MNMFSLGFIFFIFTLVASILIVINDGPRDLFLIPIVLFIASFAFSVFGTESLYKTSFIEHGMAEYRVDKQTGRTEFIYLEPVEFLNNLGEE